MLASLGLIVLASALPKTGWWLALTPMLPLVAYHLLYLRRHASQGLRSAEVDSVYYFGFLITVATLATTAFEISRHPNAESFPLHHFAVGLLATGYAVIARMHLQAQSVTNEGTGPEQMLENYVVRSGVLIDSLETAIVRMSTFAQTVESETIRIHERSRELLEQSVIGVAKTFEVELKASLATARSSIEQVRALLSDTAFVAERNELRRLVADTIDHTTKVNETFVELARRTQASADSMLRVDGATKQLEASSSLLRQEFERLSKGQETLPGITSEIRATATASREASEHARSAAAAVWDLAGVVGQSQNAFIGLGNTAVSTQEDLARLGEAAKTLYGAVTVAREAAQAAESFSAGLLKAGESLPALHQGAAALTTQVDSLRGSLGTVATSLERDVQRSTQAVIELANGLSAVAQTIIDRTRERQARV